MYGHGSLERDVFSYLNDEDTYNGVSFFETCLITKLFPQQSLFPDLIKTSTVRHPLYRLTHATRTNILEVLGFSEGSELLE